MFACPKCKDASHVMQTFGAMRKRACLRCGYVFTTTETIISGYTPGVPDHDTYSVRDSVRSQHDVPDPKFAEYEQVMRAVAENSDDSQAQTVLRDWDKNQLKR